MVDGPPDGCQPKPARFGRICARAVHALSTVPGSIGGRQRTSRRTPRGSGGIGRPATGGDRVGRTIGHRRIDRQPDRRPDGGHERDRAVDVVGHGRSRDLEMPGQRAGAAGHRHDAQTRLERPGPCARAHRSIGAGEPPGLVRSDASPADGPGRPTHGLTAGLPRPHGRSPRHLVTNAPGRGVAGTGRWMQTEGPHRMGQRRYP